MKVNDKEIVLDTIQEVEEVFYEMRKNIPQTFYVGEVKAGVYQGSMTIPNHLVGFYKMSYPDDLTDVSFEEALKIYDFIPCKRKVVTEYVTEFISPLMVCYSAAGYYVGEMYADTELGMEKTHFCLPYSRESGYFSTYEEAAKHLEELMKGEM